MVLTAVLARNTSLTSLDLRGNPGLGASGGQRLAEAIAGHPALLHVHLDLDQPEQQDMFGQVTVPARPGVPAAVRGAVGAALVVSQLRRAGGVTSVSAANLSLDDAAIARIADALAVCMPQSRCGVGRGRGGGVFFASLLLCGRCGPAQDDGAMLCPRC